MILPTLGVVIVTFDSADVILDCLESLLASEGAGLDIIVVDNASTDETVALLRGWAGGDVSYTPPADLPFALTANPRQIDLSGTQPTANGHRVTLIETGVNGGFAGGVNVGLAHLKTRADLDRFWILNPDSAVPATTARAFATHPTGPEGFALMGGRVLYYDTPGKIQIDGGTVHRGTGVTGNVNLFRPHPGTPAPDPATFDFITGASMVASRAFYEKVGPLREDYFLYYEEVDWALRRGSMPLAYCPDGIVYHRAGTAIGSAKLAADTASGNRVRPASAFSVYFKHRARLRFVRRFHPASLPIALAYSLAKAAQLAIKGYRGEATALLRGGFGLPAPSDVTARLSDDAARRAFGR